MIPIILSTIACAVPGIAMLIFLKNEGYLNTKK
jgi:hypothetical protein|nr:MAG TPA: hypothetical protein [Bacteriophage sp.]